MPEIKLYLMLLVPSTPLTIKYLTALHRWCGNIWCCSASTSFSFIKQKKKMTRRHRILAFPQASSTESPTGSQGATWLSSILSSQSQEFSRLVESTPVLLNRTRKLPSGNWVLADSPMQETKERFCFLKESLEASLTIKAKYWYRRNASMLP